MSASPRDSKSNDMAATSQSSSSLVDSDLRGLIQFAKSAIPADGGDGQFGKYVIRKELANSCQSMIFRANDPDLNRTVILKVSKPGARLKQESLLEGRALAAINNPHVVKVLSLGYESDWPYLVLENIAGRTLEELVAGEGLATERAAIRIACQIAEGLREIHNQGLLHLDLKPGNIMIEKNGNVKIIDFGLARHINQVSLGEIFGTPGFLAPERINDQPEKIGRPTDLFGLGGVMFFLLTGKSPFPGNEGDEVVFNSMSGNINLEALQNCRASSSLKRLVESCIAISPAERPQSASEFLARVKRVHAIGVAKWTALAGLTAAAAAIAAFS